MILHAAASADGRHLAVRRGAAVTLRSLEPGAIGDRVAEAPLPADDGALAFVAGRLVDVAPAGHRTLVTALSLPKLGGAQTIEVPGSTRLVGAGPRHLLLGGGPVAHVVLGHQQLGFAPMRVPGTIDWAVGLGEAQFLVGGSRGVEVWDAAARRPASKLHLTLPPGVRAVGLASQRANLWVTTGRAELLVIRVSDGKTTRLPLPAPPEAPYGHPESSWIVAELAGAPTAINLITGASEALPTATGQVRAIAPRGAGALLVQVGADGAIDVWELGAAPADAPPPPGGLRLDVTPGAAPPRAAPAPRADQVRLHPDAVVELIAEPDPEAPLRELAARLRRRWLDLVVDDWLRGTIDREPALAPLVAEAGAIAAPAAPRVTRLRVRGRGRDAATIALDAPEALARAGRMLGALARAASAVDARDDDARRVFDAIWRAGLTAPAEPPAFEGQLEPGQVAGLGGATLLANLDGAHVLVDPRLPPTPPGAPVPSPAVADLPALAAIVLTGADLDPATLALLDKDVPVYAAAPHPLLAALGFARVAPLDAAPFRLPEVPRLPPGRATAPIEDGWRWILDPPATWLVPREPPRLPAIEAYDVYRIGEGPDGWLTPRVG